MHMHIARGVPGLENGKLDYHTNSDWVIALTVPNGILFERTEGIQYPPTSTSLRQGTNIQKSMIYECWLAS